MRQLRFSPQLTRVGIITVTALLLSFAVVPSAHATPSASISTDADDVATPSEADSAESSTPDLPAPEHESDPAESPGDDVAHSVPTPYGDDAVITVAVGGDRTRANAVGNLSGVKLRLYKGDSSGPTDPLTNTWAACTSDPNGDCSFVVPETSQVCVDGGILFCYEWANQANRDRRFWVVQESAPNGWTANSRFAVGSNGTNSVAQYAFRTGPRLRSESVYRSGYEFMTTDGRDTTTNSTGTWQNTRRNPSLRNTCATALRVGLVLDLSGSVGISGQVDTLKNSAKGMVDALKGSNAEMALYTFSTDAPRSSGNDGRNWPSTPIDVGGNADTIKSRIDAYATGGGTNWDSGLWQVANSREKHDLVIVVTDGLPTYSYGNTSGSGVTTSFAAIEPAIFSSNAIKARGSRVMAIGVGDGVNGSAENLAAITGTNRHSTGNSIIEADYVEAGWTELADLLSGVALGATCRADIEIVKRTIGTGATRPAPGGAGWRFAGTASTPGVLDPDGEQSTGADSRVDFTVKFPTPTPDQSSTVRIEELLSGEQSADGWTLESIGCLVNGKKVAVDDSSIGLDVTVGDTVTCTVTNKQHLVPDISIAKRAWDTPTADGLAGAKEITSGATVTDGRTITWTYLVENTGKTPLDGITVVDDRLPASAVKCPKTRLNPGETMTCSASGAVSK